MLLTGYLTIFHYDEEKDVCTLHHANKEVEYDLLKRIRTYILCEKKCLENVEWAREDLYRALESENITRVVEVLNKISFPPYHDLSENETVKEEEVRKRLAEILENAGVLSVHPLSGNIFFGNVTQGDVDIATQNLPKNFIFEIKCGDESLMKAVKQPITYATSETKRSSYIEALEGDHKVNLLAIHFTEDYGGLIDDWVLTPFEAEKLRFDKMKASSADLSKMDINPSYIVK